MLFDKAKILSANSLFQMQGAACMAFGVNVLIGARRHWFLSCFRGELHEVSFLFLHLDSLKQE